MRKSFIKIPILVAIVAGVIAIGTIGYVVVINYQKSQDEKEIAIQEEIRAREEREKQTQQLLTNQQTSLEEARQEIEKLKQESDEAKQKQVALEQKVGDASKITKKDIFISSSELAPYLTGVVEIDCADSQGSGSLWNLPGVGHVVLTNKHVAGTPYYPVGKCWIDVSSSERGNVSGNFYTIGIYSLRPSTKYLFKYQQNLNKDIDIALLPIELGLVDKDGKPLFGTPIASLNYEISSLRRCAREMAVGSPVVLIGFPAFAEKTVEAFGHTQNESFRTITNGIISAHDTSVTGIFGDLPYVNYFVSAKIDSGNSGGIAFSKDEEGLCVLGVPTWLTVGNYETQGLIQNIHNIFLK